MLIKKIFLALTRGERAVFWAAIVLAIISGLTLVGLEFVKATEAVPASGGEFVQGFVGQPVRINPVTASSDIDKSLVRIIFSSLNDMADKIEVSSDGRTWNVRLKENLRWQDNEKLTSDDVIFTVQKIQDAESNSPLFNAWQGVTPHRLSELELQFKLANPYAFFSETLKNLYILPKHLFADAPPANWKLSDYNIKPVGNGPYKFVSYDKRPDGFIYIYKLAAWNNYFGDKPLIQSIDFQFFSKSSDLIKSFDLGQVDGIAGINPEELAEISRPNNLFSFSLPGYYAVFLNQGKSVQLKDAAVRKALNLAVDRGDLIANVLGGRGEADAGPVPPGSYYFNPEIETSTASFDLASSTLDGAGWKVGGDGVREKTINAVDVPLELNLTVPQVEFLVKTAELLQKSWQKVGFKINLAIKSSDEIGGVIQNRDYEMLLFGNALGRSPDLFSFWHSSERFYPGLNLSLYNNPKADALIESIRQNMDDASRKSQFDNLQSLIVNDNPAVFLYSTKYLYAAGKNLHGLNEGPIAEPADIFAGINKWYLKTARVLK